MECGVQPSLLTGWDCHGLPIELKAIKGGKRLEASKVANITKIKRQNKRVTQFFPRPEKSQASLLDPLWKPNPESFKAGA